MYEQKIKTIIVNGRKKGISYRHIGKIYGIPKSSVQHIIENYGKTSIKRNPKEKLTKGDNIWMKSFIQTQYDKNVKWKE